MSRQSSREALNAYRYAPDRDIPVRRPSTETSRAWDRTVRRDTWGGGGYLPNRFPPYVARSQRNYGMWDAAFLWGLLESLSRPGHAEFFHNYQDDPGYRAWRAQAEADALNDPVLRQKLDDLDRRLASMQNQPRLPSYLPPDITPEEAVAASANESEKSSGGLLLLLIVCAFIAYFGWRSLAGDIAAKNKPMFQNPLKKPAYQPKWFRVGMTLPVDPSLFLLAADATHIHAPPQLTSSGLISVESVGLLQCGETSWHRLYLQGENFFFQVHLDDRGNPDECRYFSLLDEIDPATHEEWDFWLGEQEGMIGWPEFQTKDGKLYQRIWSQGLTRMAPRRLEETISSASAQKVRTHQAMLYGAATGMSAPAPQSEYVWVATIDDGSQSWIAIYAGVDVSVSSLNLS